MRSFSSALVLGAVLAVAPAVPAAADEEPRGNAPIEQRLDVTIDPLGEENFITDEMEAAGGTGSTGVTCEWEPVLTGPNPAPATPSFQMLYVVPQDVTATPHLDVPRSCSDGSLKYSSLARGSRNFAAWQAAQGAGLNYRTVASTYHHNFSGSAYSTRSVRRFRSADIRANWNSSPMGANNEPSPRLAKLRSELSAAGFDKAGTKYKTLLDAGVYPTCDATGRCGHAAGVTTLHGTYALLNRYYFEPGTYATKYHRFGCATQGDVLFAHEATHQVGAQHVYDHNYDIMTEFGGNGTTFKSSPGTHWDYNRNDYHATVRANAYVSLTAQSGNYFKC